MILASKADLHQHLALLSLSGSQSTTGTMYQMKKYTSPGLIPHRPQTSPHQERPSLYGSSVSGDGGVSSADPKPRLRWTPELHERFVDAIAQLGGADSKLTFSYSSICSQMCTHSSSEN